MRTFTDFDELSAAAGEELGTSDWLLIDQKRNAVRLKGRTDEKKAAYNMRSDAKEKLNIWLVEEIQEDLFGKLCGDTSKTFANTPDAPAASRSVFAGGQSAANGLTATMTFDTKVLGRAKQVAQTAAVKIRPIKYDDEGEREKKERELLRERAKHHAALKRTHKAVGEEFRRAREATPKPDQPPPPDTA